LLITADRLGTGQEPHVLFGRARDIPSARDPRLSVSASEWELPDP
jgi:hypothetical protein